MEVETITVNMAVIVGAVGVLAFFVSIVTELVKKIWPFTKIPTDAFVLVLSVGISVATFLAYMQLTRQKAAWYMIAAAVMAGFIVAFVAMYGWEKLKLLWKRFRKGADGVDEIDDLLDK